MDESRVPMPITIWSKDLINKIMEKKIYRFTNLATSVFKEHLKLSSTINTEVSESANEATFDWSTVSLNNNTRQCCPTIVSVKKNTFVSCQNKKCHKKISVFKSDVSEVDCEACHFTMLLKSCTLNYSIDVMISVKEKQLMLTAFPELVEAGFVQLQIQTQSLPAC